METLESPLEDLRKFCRNLKAGESFQASPRWIRLATLAANFPENTGLETPRSHPLLELLHQDYKVNCSQNPDSGVFTFWKS